MVGKTLSPSNTKEKQKNTLLLIINRIFLQDALFQTSCSTSAIHKVYYDRNLFLKAPDTGKSKIKAQQCPCLMRVSFVRHKSHSGLNSWRQPFKWHHIVDSFHFTNLVWNRDKNSQSLRGDGHVVDEVTEVLLSVEFSTVSATAKTYNNIRHIIGVVR